MKVELPSSVMGYAVFGKDEKFNGFIEHGASPEEIITKLRAML